jgi:hypothetical protein
VVGGGRQALGVDRARRYGVATPSSRRQVSGWEKRHSEHPQLAHGPGYVRKLLLYQGVSLGCEWEALDLGSFAKELDDLFGGSLAAVAESAVGALARGMRDGSPASEPLIRGC